MNKKYKSACYSRWAVIKTYGIGLISLLGLSTALCLPLLANAHISLNPNVLDYEDTQTFGLPVIVSEESVIHQTRELDVYQTHQMPVMVAFGDLIYVFWKKNILDESKPDGRTVYSRSKDGVNWSAPTVVLSREALTNDPTRIPTLPAVFTYEGQLHLIQSLHHNEAFIVSSPDGVNWSEPKSLGFLSSFEAPRQLESGRWIWLGQGPRLTARDWERNLWAFTAKENPILPESWVRSEVHHVNSLRGRWVEPTHFIRPEDGALVAVTRPGSDSSTLFAAVSTDEGRTFSKTDTDFPDAMSRPAAGNLPDGRVFLLNNPGPRGNRSILTLALSEDGRVFNRIYALGYNAPPIRWPAYGKSPSLMGYQHPQAIIWQDKLLVVCTRNKEDIVLFRIPLDNLTK